MNWINRDKRLEDGIDSRLDFVQETLTQLVTDARDLEKLKNEHLDETDSDVIS